MGILNKTEMNENQINVNKNDYEIHKYIDGYYGICVKNTHICVFGGDSANVDDYNEEFMKSVYDNWNGDLTYCGYKYGYRIEL